MRLRATIIGRLAEGGRDAVDLHTFLLPLQPVVKLSQCSPSACNHV